jgi:hypothetical protein
VKDDQLLRKGSATSKVSLTLYHANVIFIIHDVIIAATEDASNILVIIKKTKQILRKGS